VVGPFANGGHHQEGGGEHRQGGPAVRTASGGPDAVPAAQPLAGVEAFLDGPAPPGDPDQGGQGDRARCPAVVEGQLTGGAVAAYQQPALASLAAGLRVAVVQADQRPTVPIPWRSSSARRSGIADVAPPGEPARDPAQELLQPCLPSARVYVQLGGRQPGCDPVEERRPAAAGPPVLGV
jgi:hypothetical protein